MLRASIDWSRFGIAEISDFLKYEKVDDGRVQDLCEDFIKQKILINPVICDPNIRLLIDGHHRAEAFINLGIKYIATYNVNYFSNEVKVENWYRFIYEVDYSEIENIISSIKNDHQLNGLGQDINIVHIRIESVNRVLNRIPFSNVDDLSVFFNSLCGGINQCGGTIELRAKKGNIRDATKNLFILSIEPPINKNHVISFARSKRLFQCQINRHLIANRPLGINLPIRIFGFDLETAQKKYHHHIKKCDSVTYHEGIWHWGRFYEESTILFNFSFH